MNTLPYTQHLESTLIVFKKAKFGRADHLLVRPLVRLCWFIHSGPVNPARQNPDRRVVLAGQACQTVLSMAG